MVVRCMYNKFRKLPKKEGLSTRMSSVAKSCIFIFMLLAESRAGNLAETQVRSSSKTSSTEDVTDGKIVNPKGSGNYGWGWGAGGGGRAGSGRGGGGGGGGGAWFGWGCMSNNRKRSNKMHKKTVFSKHNFVMGEFAECIAKTRCYGMRLDCPLHCGGPCLCDCVNMCKSHCLRRGH